MVGSCQNKLDRLCWQKQDFERTVGVQSNTCIMKTKLTLFVTVLAAALFGVGCVASGQKYSEYSSQIADLDPESSRIFFYRKNNFFGSGVQPQIKLNGKVVGKSQPNGFFYVDAEPGDQQVSAKTEVEKTLIISLSKGQVEYVRSSPALGLLIGRINFQIVEEAKALNEMQHLRYTGNVGVSKKAAEPCEISMP